MMALPVREAVSGSRCRIRPFRPEDRPAVREICAATGLLGDDIRRLFPEPDFFADLFTSYYTDLEPESCLVAEDPGMEGGSGVPRPPVRRILSSASRPSAWPEECGVQGRAVSPDAAEGAQAGVAVVGYLLGCTNQARYRRYQSRLLLRITCRVLRGLLQGEFHAAARSYLWWAVRSSWREAPRTPADGAHFHLNFLKEWRNHNATLPMVESFLELLRREHPDIPSVWGQMSTYGRRRSAAVFRRFGWQFYDQVRLTKYDGVSRVWSQASVGNEDEAGHGPDSHKYARYQLPEIYLTTIYREVRMSDTGSQKPEKEF